MNQRPGSRLDSKVNTLMRDNIRNAHLDDVSSELNRIKRAKKNSEYRYRNLKMKEFIQICVTSKMKNFNSDGTKSIYELVSILKDEKEIKNVTMRVKTMISSFDSKEHNTVKIKKGPKDDLSNQIRHMYELYLIELLVRFEAERLKRFNCSGNEIAKILCNQGDAKHARISKKIRLKIRSALKDIYGAEDSEQKIDKLRKDTVRVMRSVADKYRAEKINSEVQVKQEQDAPDI